MEKLDYYFAQVGKLVKVYEVLHLGNIELKRRIEIAKAAKKIL